MAHLLFYQNIISGDSRRSMYPVSAAAGCLGVCVDAVNLASSLALTEGMLAAHLLPFTLFMALQIKTTFTHSLPRSPRCTAHLATHIASSARCSSASGPLQYMPSTIYSSVSTTFEHFVMFSSGFCQSALCLVTLCQGLISKFESFDFFSLLLYSFYYSVIHLSPFQIFQCVLKFSRTVL